MMRLTASVMMALCLFSGTARAAESMEEIRDEVFPKFGSGLEELASRSDVDEPTFLETVTFRDSKFQRIIQECFEIMSDSPLIDLLALQDEVRDGVRERQEKLGRLAGESLTAPADSWNPLATTQERLRRDMEKLRGEIADMEASLAAQKDRVYAGIEANGVPLKREQFDAMINAADAVETAKIMAVAGHLRYMLQSMEGQVSAPDAPLEMLKMYSGIYMMCYRVYIYAVANAIVYIEHQYQPRLAEIKKKNDDLMDESRSLRRQLTSDDDRRTLDSNMASQKRMDEVIDLYGRYLKKKAKELENLNREMGRHYRVAENTYRTIQLSSQLLELVRTSRSDFSRIFSFRTPELGLLLDERLSREFAEVTAALREH